MFVLYYHVGLLSFVQITRTFWYKLVKFTKFTKFANDCRGKLLEKNMYLQQVSYSTLTYKHNYQITKYIDGNFSLDTFNKELHQQQETENKQRNKNSQFTVSTINI